MTDRETRVREIAYTLWEQEGFPEGKHDAHWYEAEAVYDTEVAGDEVKPEAPDDMALSETAAVRAASPAGKAQQPGSKAKAANASARDASPANENTAGGEGAPSSARAR